MLGREPRPDDFPGSSVYVKDTDLSIKWTFNYVMAYKKTIWDFPSFHSIVPVIKMTSVFWKINLWSHFIVFNLLIFLCIYSLLKFSRISFSFTGELTWLFFAFMYHKSWQGHSMKRNSPWKEPRFRDPQGRWNELTAGWPLSPGKFSSALWGLEKKNTA